MKVRLANTAPGWLLCAATSVILVGNAEAQDSRANPKKTLNSAVQREMELLLGKRAAAQQSDHRPTNADARLHPGTRESTSNSLARKWLSKPEPTKPEAATTAKAAPARLASQDAKPAVVADRVATSAIKPAAGTKPEAIQQPANRVVQTAGKSDIEKELEKLYQKDGRQMPPMDLRQAPNTNFPVPGYKQPQLNSARRTSASPQQGSARNQAPAQAQPKKRGIGGFLSRLNPFRKRQKETQTPPENVAQQAPVQTRTPAPVRRPIQARPQPKVAVQTQPTVGQPARLPSDVTNSQAAPSKFIPPAPTVADTKKPAVKLEAKPTVAKSPIDDDFPNPFADDPNPAKAPVVEAKPATTVKPEPTKTDSNPFTGLTLDDPKKAEPAKLDRPAVPEIPDLDLPKTAAKPIPASKPKVETTPTRLIPSELKPATVVEAPKPIPETKPESKPTAPKVADTKPAAKPEAKVAKTEPKPAAKSKHADKLQKIAARKGMKGLKGFCSVALRDERDLVDTSAEFSSTYGLKTYYFSSAEAKVRFDRTPAKYAPTAEGFDVVKLAEDTEDVEGSLDHAAWYKDRLYLFSSTGNRLKFIANPADFAVEE